MSFASCITAASIAAQLSKTADSNPTRSARSASMNFPAQHEFGRHRQAHHPRQKVGDANVAAA
eukprot:6322862-Prymnesium_polylepis.1